MARRTLLAVLVCWTIVQGSYAQQCAVNQCPDTSLNCYDRNVPGELPYVCECANPFTQGAECTSSADTQEVFTCYGDACRSGTFSSINYPNVYNNRYRALYLLYVPGASSITFTFSTPFDIEEFKDELYVGAGLEYDDLQLDGLGNPPDWYFFEGTTPNPSSFTIESDIVWMYFGTDKNIQREGFELSWSSVVDSSPPVFINCPANIVQTVELGVTSTPVSWTIPTATDDSAFTTTASHVPGSSFTTGTTTTVFYTATDEFENVGICSFTVSVVAADTIPPVVTVTSSTITRQVELGAAGIEVSFIEPTATDNVGTPFLVSRTAAPGDFFAVGQTAVIYTFSDAAGNTATGTVLVNVVEVDTTPPTIQNCPSNIVQSVELGTTGATATWTEPTATDLSGIASTTSTSSSGSFFNVGSTTVTYTFIDGAGNSNNNCVFTVTIVTVDTTPPVVTVTSSSITRQVELGTPGIEVSFTEPTANDNSGNVFLVSRTAAPGDFFAVGQTAVIYTFSDAAGNTATGTVLVNVVEVDTTPPVVTVTSSSITRQVELGATGIEVSFTEPTANDNSGNAFLVSRTAAPGDFFAVGQTTVIYTFSDAAGNTATGTVLVNVVEVDTTPPVVTVTSSSITRQVELGTPGIEVSFTEPTANDNSGNVFLVSRTAAPGDFFAVGQTTVIYTFSDAAGNTATGTVLVNVVEVDTTPPVVTVTSSSITRQVELGTPGIEVSFTEPTANDNSGNAFLVSRTAAPGDFFAVGQTTVIYTFSDAAGNTATGTVLVNVVEVDTTPPVVTVTSSSITRQVELGTPGIEVSFTEPTAIDNSGNVFLVSRTAAPGDFFAVGQTTVIYTFSDAAGNTATGTVLVNVVEVDTTPPVVTVTSSSITRQVELGTPGIEVSFTEPTANDNSGNVFLVSRTAAPGDFFAVGQTAVIYTFSDAAGNTATGTVLVNVVEVDTTPPVVTVTSSSITRQVELGTPGIEVSFTEPTANDNSGNAFLVSRTAAPGDFFAVGQTAVIYTFSDAAGNTATGTVLVNVVEVDTTPPVVTVTSSSITRQVELGATGIEVSFTEPTANDNSGNAFLVSRTAAPGDFFAVGQTAVIYTFSDAAGNTATGTVLVNVVEVDTTPPTIQTCPSNVVQSVELGSAGATVTWAEPTATDLSGIASTSSTSSSGSFFSVGTTTVTYTFVDGVGNINSNCAFTVTVTTVLANDTTPPSVFISSSNIVRQVELGEPGLNVFFAEPVAIDDSGTAVLVNSTAQPGDFFPIGQTLVEYVFSDPSGNRATGIFTVTVIEVDLTPPIVVTDGDIVRMVAPGVTRISVTYNEPSATDNSGTVFLVSRSAQPGDLFPLGFTVVQYVFSDPSGNLASGNFTVTVTSEADTTPPTVQCIGDVVQTVELGSSGVQVFFTEPTATDLSNSVSLVSRTAGPGDFFSVGTTTVSYVFADGAGNVAAPCTFTVTVNTIDTTPPTVNCINDIVQTVELGTSSAQVFYAEPTATDLSGQPSLLSRSSSPGDSFAVGTTIVTYIFTDNSGNTADPCVFTITVNTVDTTPPTVNCINNIVRSVELGVTSLVVSYTEPTATDLSGTEFLVSRTNAPGDSYPLGTTAVTYIFSDASGNQATPCTFTIMIGTMDTMIPDVAGCPNNIAQSVELGVSGAVITWTAPTADDEAGIASIIPNIQPGTFFSVGGSQQVTYTITDNSGLVDTSCSFSVTVFAVDTTPPTVTCINDIFQNVELGTTSAVVTYTEPTATDISGQPNLITRTNAPGDTFPLGTTTVTYIFADNSGNTATPCTFTVTVSTVDTTPPTVTCINDIVQTIELGQSQVQVFYTEPTASDISSQVNLVTRTSSPGDNFPVGTTSVTYIFVDGSGNQADPCTFTVTVNTVDTTPPTVACVNDIVQTVELGTTSVVVSYTEPSATDISGTETLLSRTAAPGDSFAVGTTTVTYIFTDASGNQADPCSFTITVATVDTTTPVVSNCPASIVQSVELGVQGAVITWTAPTATDVSGIASIIANILPGTFFNVGESQQITYTVTDNSGLTDSSCTFTVTVFSVDTTPPTVTCVNDIVQTVELGLSGTQITYTEPTASDVSGQPSLVSRTAAPGDFFPVGTTTVTYIFTDNSGNVADPCSFNIVITTVDTTPPTVTCVNDIVQTVELGTSGVQVFFTEPSAVDVSGQPSLLSRTNSPGDTYPVGSTTVTYIFVDSSGNVADPCTFVITVNTVDTTPPTVQCVDNIERTVELGTTSLVIAYTEPSATDISGTAALQSRSNAPGDAFPLGTTVVIYLFVDASGNQADPCTFTVTVNTVDTTTPVVSNCPASIVQSVELGVQGAVITWTAPTATDVSGIASIIANILPGTFFNVGESQQITYTVTDNSGLTDSSCTFTVTVFSVDTTPPTVTCVNDIVQTVELGLSGTQITYTEPTASDVSGQPSLVSRTAAPGDFFPVGTTTVTYIFTDNSGNVADPCSFNIIINTADTTPPTVTCVNDIVQTVELGTSGAQVFFTEPSAVDVSGQPSLLSRTNSPGDTYPVGSTTVTYIFVDSSGNVADPCTFVITVNTVDTTPPTVQCVDNIERTVELGTTSLVIAYTEPSATDISGTAALQSRSNAPGDAFPLGTTVVIYLFVDASGNQADPCTFTVTVNTVDTTTPVVSNCPASIVQSVELGVQGAVITWTAPTATDVSGIASIIANLQPGTFFNVGESQQITYTVTDNSGLTDSSCTFTVTVFSVDTTPPTVTCVNDIIQSVELGLSGTQITYTEPTASDVSGQPSLVSRTAAPGDFFPVGTTTVTYIFTDNSGNVADPCSFNIVITTVDTTPPTVTCVNDIVQTVELGTSGAQVFFTEPSAVDVSGQPSLLSRTNSPGDTFPVGSTTVTYVFVDSSGNVADPCTFVITVNTVDTTPPDVTCINDIVQTVELGTSSVQVVFTEPSATDISNQVNLVSRSNAPGDSFPVGVTTVTYIFVDNAGNQADPCVFTVTVNTVDTTPPTVTCIDNISQTVELGTTSVVVFYAEPSATDISGTAALQTRSNAPGDSFPVGTTVVTYIFTDASGNDADPCVFMVSVVAADTTDPTVTNCPSNIAQSVELGVQGSVITWTAPTATDLSGIASVIADIPPGTFFNVGESRQVSYTVTDGSGNTDTSCFFTVTVFSVDTTPPTVTCVDDITQSVELGTSSLQINYAEPTATDISMTSSLVSRTNLPGEFFPVGTTTITYIFTDASGNNADPCTFTINVIAIDTTPPTVTCQSDIARTIELGNTGVEVFFTEPSAVDISGQVNTVTATAQSGDFFPVGVTTVTYIFADDVGNTATPCTFTVTVNTVDTTPPSVTCIDDIVQIVELGTTSVVIFYTEPSATDISGPALLQTRTNAPGDLFPVGTSTVSYVFVDGSGNQADPCTFTVTVATVDTTPPTVSECPDSIAQSVELGSLGTVITWQAPTAMDLSGIASIVADIQPGTFFSVGESRQVTYTVIDNSGLTDASCVFTVTIFAVDTTPPTVTCVMNIIQSVELGTSSAVIEWTEPTANDISGTVITRSQSHTSGSSFPVGVTTVTYVFTDGSNNDADPCVFTITIIEDDSTHPTVMCTNNQIRTVELGTAGTEVFYTVPTATDISGTEQIISQSHDTGDFFSVGVTTVTYIFADASGNVAPTCSFNVTVNTVDTTPPTVVNCPDNIVVTVELGTASTPVTWVQPSATDISGTAQIVSQSRQPGVEFSAGTTTTIVIIFADDSGNQADPCTFTVTINTVDTTPPTVQNCPDDIIRTIEVNSATSLAITWSPPTATDISGTQFVSSQSANVGDLFPVSATTVVTYVFSDASGNDADPCSFNVIILTEDTTPPVIAGCPSDITETTPLNSGGTTITWVAPTATDNSLADPIVSVSQSPNTFFLTGDTVVTYTFSDLAGNTANCAFTIRVIEVDTENPVITNCPSDISIDTPLGTALTVVTWPTLIVTDNSGLPSLLSQSAASGDSFAPGRTTITIIYTDPSSNTDICQFTVTVREVDYDPPQILTCPADITAEVPLESAGTTVTWSTPVVTDNSGIAPTVTSTYSPGTFFLRGSTQVTYTFTDGSGNQVSCSFVITVITVDNVGPTVVCPDSITVTVLEGVDGSFVSFDPPTVTDNSGATNFVSSTSSSGDFYEVGTTVVTFTYADSSGNEASCSFVVSVVTDSPCNPNPCFNSGACVVQSLTEYQCVCPECFTGTNCETAINACDGNVCQNGAACVAYPGSCDSYYCECPSCFTGTFCDVPVDACDNNQCENGAACVLDDDTCLTYTCSCPLCYTGEFCQTKVDACDGNACQNGAACVPVGDLCTEYTCSCSGCFTGDLCDEVRDACDPNPCLNGAACTTLSDSNCYSYTCECSGCFTGYNCEEAIPSPCENDPCQNGGVCSVIAGVCSGYQCTCPAGFSGVNCDEVTIVNTNPCNNFPCQNGGSCHNEDSNTYTCLCRDGFTGIDCQTSTASSPALDSCASAPCLNGATCVNSYTSDALTSGYFPQYSCICETGFTGTNCGISTGDLPALDVCTQGSQPPCENGGVCRNLYESIAQSVDSYCDCPVGWTGMTCDTSVANPCASGPCENGGVCTASNTYFTCDCPDGFSGTTCEVAFGDNDAPVINDCPEDIIRTITSGTGVGVTWTEPTATDAGTVQRLLRSHVPGTFFALGDTAVSYVFTDNSANLAKCEFFVTVTLEETDSTPPVIQNCPSTVVVQATSGTTSAEASWTEPTAVDNSGTEVTVANNYDPGQSFPVGSTTVTYTFTDDAGNQNTCTFSVTVVLVIVNASPTITFCPAGPLRYSTVGASEVAVDFPVPTATDDSGIAPSVTSNIASGQVLAVGTYTVTYTFTDNVGLTSECTFNVEVLAGGDVTAPTVSDCPTMAVTGVAPAGASGMTVTWDVPSATDDSGDVVSTTSTASPGSFFLIGTTTVTYTFTDSSGNVAQCIFNVIITGTDVTVTPAPTNLVLTPGSDALVATWTPPADGAYNGYVITVGTAANPTLISQALPQSSTSYTATGLASSTAYTVALYATGNNGNSSPISGSASTSGAVDTTGPTASNCPASQTIVAAFGTTSAAASWTEPTFSDPSGVASVSSNFNSGSSFPVGVTTVVYTATDSLGNVGTCDFTVTVQSESGQAPDSPSNLNLAAGSDSITVTWTAPSGSVTGYNIGIGSSSEDADDVTVALAGSASSYTFTGLESSTLYFVSLSAFNNFGTSASAEGSTTTSSAPIVSSGPVIENCPVAIPASLPFGTYSYVSWEEPTATSALGPVTTTQSPGFTAAYFRLGTYTITYEFADVNGETAVCTFDIVVSDGSDTEPPVITSCPSGPIQGQEGTPVTWAAPQATDASLPITTKSNYASGDTFPAGTTTVVINLIDAAGYYSTCSFDVVVSGSGVDNVAPVFSDCPTDITAEAFPGTTEAVVSWVAPTATDAVDGAVTPVANFPSGSTFGAGSTAVVYTATDSQGNVATCSFNVAIFVTAPVITFCPDAAQTVSTAGANAVVNFQEPSATDDTVLTVTSTHQPGDVFPLGETVVTYTFTDDEGLTVTCSFSIIVVTTDTSGPTASNCPSSQAVTAAFGSSAATATWTEPTFSDASGVASVDSNFNSGSFFPLGTTTVTYTATDNLGNVGVCQFTVTVVSGSDNVVPVFTNCPADISVTVPFGTAETLISWTAPSATDNSGDVTVTSTANPGDSFPVGASTVTYTATDGSGNSAFCQFSVTITASDPVDVTPPVLANCPSDISTTAVSGSSFAIVTWTPPTATDNAGVPVVNSNFPSGSSFPIGTTTVVYTATDDAGNSASCNFDVVVTAASTNNAPVVTLCPANDEVYYTAPGGNAVAVNFEAPTATDDSGSFTTTSTNQPGDIFSLGTHTITYTFTDDAGLSAECSFTIIVEAGANPCSSNPCQANEQCFYITTQYLCIASRRRRDTSTLDLSDICPCMNGGQCVLDETIASASCQCPVGYAGLFCEMEMMAHGNANVLTRNDDDDHEHQAWSNGNGALLWAVIVCMAVLLVVVISLSGVLCYVLPKLAARHYRRKADEIPIYQ